MRDPISKTAEAEPTTAQATTSMWLVGLLFILFFGAAWSFDQRGGWFDKQVYGSYKSPEDFIRFQPPAEGLPDGYLLGRKLYANCSVCHLDTGLGSASVGAPPLRDSEWVLAPKPDRIIRIVLDGLSGPITVKGQQYGTGQMNQFRPALTDEQIAAILTYLRYQREWKHNASPVTPAEVKAVRETTKDRSSNWSEAELLKVPAN